MRRASGGCRTNPSLHLCGHTHDFQSCSLSRSDISPVISIFLNHRDVTCYVSTSIISGGERGIRTPVGACGPQIDFESIPLRPLRYLSTYFIRLSMMRFLISFFPSLLSKNFSRILIISRSNPGACSTACPLIFRRKIHNVLSFRRRSQKALLSLYPGARWKSRP